MRLNSIVSFCLAGVLFIISSCEDDDSAPAPVFTSCLPTVATEGQKITNLTYTGDKLTSFSTGTQTTTIEYNADGKPGTLTYSGSNDEVAYSYNMQGTLISMSVLKEVEGGISVLTTQYEYTNTKITKATQFSRFLPTSGPSTIPVPRGYTTYTYDAKGNMLETKVYNAQNILVSLTERSNYDDKVNPNAFLESLAGPASPNNARTEVKKDGTGTIDKAASFTNVFTYNETGYPTKVEKTNQNGVKSQSTFAYSCK